MGGEKGCVVRGLVEDGDSKAREAAGAGEWGGKDVRTEDEERACYAESVWRIGAGALGNPEVDAVPHAVMKSALRSSNLGTVANAAIVRGCRYNVLSSSVHERVVSAM